ncbi:MAG: phage virion morphogenesis protein [bacterium]|nr:phage virion morphogenesis protein [bacterium]
MSGFSVHINVEGLSALGGAEAALRGIRERAKDLTAPLRAGGFHMLRSIRENFRAGGRPTRWKPLASATLKAKASKTNLLVDTGRLMGSITFRAERDELAVGSNVIYARIHQLGGRAGRGHATTIPARPYLVFQKSDVEVIGRLVGEHLAGEA